MVHTGNAYRDRIYRYIHRNPGEHFEAIKRQLDMKNGTFAYHIKVLEREGRIHSRHIGRKTVFFDKRSAARKVQFSGLQRRLLAVIGQHPGICQCEIQEHLKVKQQTLSYNIRKLEHAGAIRLLPAGRKKQIYLIPESPPPSYRLH